jgi:KDO2-lipid IV(A) lauroyltransferase
MNQRLEVFINTMPDQYFWVHKRFKTRPAGEPELY